MTDLPPDTPDADSPLAQAQAERQKLVDFLATAPDDLREWATEQLELADAKVRALSSPTPETNEETTSSNPAPRDVAADTSSSEKYVDVEAMSAAPTRPEAQTPRAKAARARAAERRRKAAETQSSPARWKPLIWAALALMIPSLIVGVYLMGKPAEPKMPANHPAIPSVGTNNANGFSPQPVDPAQVKTLTDKVAANPQDVDSLRQLASLYNRSGQFSTALEWANKAIAASPKEIDARLIAGVAYFNQEKLDEAEKVWQEIIGIDPKDVKSYYNLGFLYMSKNPPALDKAQAMWQKVSELAPGSEYAKLAEAHVKRLQSPAPVTPSATPSK